MCPALRDRADLAALRWGNMIPDPGKTVSAVSSVSSNAAGAALDIGWERALELCSALGGSI